MCTRILMLTFSVFHSSTIQILLALRRTLSSLVRKKVTMVVKLAKRGARNTHTLRTSMVMLRKLSMW